MANVIPFKKKDQVPSKKEMEAYYMMTKNWSNEMKQLILPDYYKHEKNTR